MHAGGAGDGGGEPEGQGAVTEAGCLRRGGGGELDGVGDVRRSGAFRSTPVAPLQESTSAAVFAPTTLHTHRSSVASSSQA